MQSPLAEAPEIEGAKNQNLTQKVERLPKSS